MSAGMAGRRHSVAATLLANFKRMLTGRGTYPDWGVLSLHRCPPSAAGRREMRLSLSYLDVENRLRKNRFSLPIRSTLLRIVRSSRSCFASALSYIS